MLVIRFKGFGMRRISISVSICVLMFLGLSVNGYAQGQLAYGTGQPYMQIPALYPVQCEQQCRGDAACGGWNFVPPNQDVRTGVCEFHARPRSVGGQNSRSYRDGNIWPGQTGQALGRTIRVGTPIVSRAVPSGVPSVSPPRQISPSTNNDLQNSAHNQRQQYYRQQMLAAQRRIIAQQTYQQNVGIRPPRQTFIPLAQRGTMRFDLPPPHLQANLPQNPLPQIPAQIQQTPKPDANPQAVKFQAAKPQTYTPQPPSLYGSLHDDLGDLTQNMTPVPRPQTPPDRIDNPDAPLSTSRSVPSKPVEITQLETPAMSQLAGGL